MTNIKIDDLPGADKAAELSDAELEQAAGGTDLLAKTGSPLDLKVTLQKQDLTKPGSIKPAPGGIGGVAFVRG